MCKSMGKKSETEKNRERIEKRTAFVTSEISWMQEKEGWEGLKCIGAVHTESESKGVKSSEWHYYISSRELKAEELLRHARLEWSVETMHWLLDVHFSEDRCRIADKNIQQNLNMARKLAVNLIKGRKRKQHLSAPYRKSGLTVCWIRLIFVIFLKIDFRVSSNSEIAEMTKMEKV